jgi:hypothetical protein
MRVINGILPEVYAMIPGISGIPRELLVPGISRNEATAQLDTFEQFCQPTVSAISIKLSGLTLEDHDQGGFIL